MPLEPDPTSQTLEATAWREEPRWLLPLVLLWFAGGFFQHGYASDGTMQLGTLLPGFAAGLWGANRLLAAGSPLLRRSNHLVTAILAATMVAGLVTLLPLPAGIRAAVSPWHRELQTAATGSGLELPPWLPLALRPGVASAGWLSLLAAFGWWLALMAWVSLGGVRERLLTTVAILTALEGLSGFLIGDDRSRGAIYNPNHHAAFILAGLPAMTWWVVLRRNKSRRRGEDDSTRSDRRLFAIGLILIVAMSWFGTQSRASLLVGALVLPLWAAMEWRSLRDHQRGGKAWWLFISALLFALLLFFSNIPSAVSSRFGAWAEFGMGRTDLWEATLQGLPQTGFLGAGLGGTEVLLDANLQDLAMTKRAIHAHSDPVELLGDLGVPLVLLLALFLVPVLRARDEPLLPPRFWMSPRYAPRRAALLGLLTLVLHSAVDFPLRVPMVFALALLLAAVALGGQRRGATDDGE